jgi:hypothetical protein
MRTHSGNNLESTSSAAFRRRAARSLAAFTLLEVMVALGIFFMATFAILEVVSTSLRNARLLQEQPVDVSLVIADRYQTNKLEEGMESDDFGDLFPGYKWSSDTRIIATNGLFQIDFIVTHPGDKGHSPTEMSVVLWRPESQTGGTGVVGTHP